MNKDDLRDELQDQGRSAIVQIVTAIVTLGIPALIRRIRRRRAARKAKQ